MKKVLFAFMLCLSSVAYAQVLDVASITKIALPENPLTSVAGISPQGDYILVTNAQNSGLSKYDLATGETTVISTAPGAGYNAKISDDGQTVVYRETAYGSDHLRRSTLLKQDIATGTTTTVVKATRNLQGVAVTDEAIVAVENEALMAEAVEGGQVTVDVPALSIKDRQLMITRNGTTTTFSPNGTQYSYIWPSLSPDGTKVLYYICSDGAYVCDTDGSNITYLGRYTYPKWYSNNIVIANDEEDNGEFLTRSQVVAATLDGTVQTLTDSSMLAINPYASKSGDKIVFTSGTGEAYMININVK